MTLREAEVLFLIRKKQLEPMRDEEAPIGATVETLAEQTKLAPARVRQIIAALTAQHLIIATPAPHPTTGRSIRIYSLPTLGVVGYVHSAKVLMLLLSFPKRTAEDYIPFRDFQEYVYGELKMEETPFLEHMQYLHKHHYLRLIPRHFDYTENIEIGMRSRLELPYIRKLAALAIRPGEAGPARRKRTVRSTAQRA